MVSKRVNETGYLLLTALSEGESHGYALARRVSEITDGDVCPGAGSLYSTLERLLAIGHIEESGTEIVDGRERRRYRISPPGTEALAKHLARLERRVGAITSALGAR